MINEQVKANISSFNKQFRKFVLMIKNAALIILYDKNKKILLQHRTEDAKRYPGYWAFFGGQIREGEIPAEAVKREAREELNYQLNNPRLVMTQHFSDDYGYEGTKYIFMEEYDLSKTIMLSEGQGLGWYYLSETDKLKINSHDREVLKYLFKIFSCP